MKIKRIAHLGLAIKDPGPPKKLYGEHLNLEHQGDEVVAGQKVQVSFFQVGESSLELLLPTAADSPVAKFLENKGEGFHHLALEVEDIDAVGRCLDRCAELEATLSATLGRHTNDHMVSFYVSTPGGFDVEYGTGGRLVDSETWVTTEITAVSYWGHRWGVG